MDEHARLHARARARGVNPIVYWLVRAVFQPFSHLYFRLSRIGREHIPQEGPVIFAANHRSFLDPFIIGTLVRRPVYYVAKKELFARPLVAWFLNSLGAFPVDRGNGDGDMIATAKAILARGDCVVIFPEGTRTRPGALAPPKRGVGRLALETGAPVVPVALIGTEAVRRGWRIRPHKVRVRVGRPLRYPQVESASRELARAVTQRIWPCVALQWEWLGGQAPLRRAAVVGAGSWGTGVAITLARAGLQVELGCRTGGQAATVAANGVNGRYLPGVSLPDGLQVRRAADLDLAAADLVVFAVPSRSLPAAVAEHGSGVGGQAAVLVCSKGMVPDGTLPSAYVAERVPARAVAALGGPAHAAAALTGGAAVVVASRDRGLRRELAALLRTAGFDAVHCADVVGVELAGCAKNAAGLAAAAASGAGPNAAGAAAGKVFAEVCDYAAARGADPASLAGLAGVGDLVATVLAAGSRNRRAGELLGAGTPACDVTAAVGQAVEGVDAVQLLAAALREQGIAAPALTALSDLVEGRIEAADWAAAQTSPRFARRPVRAA